MIIFVRPVAADDQGDEGLLPERFEFEPVFGCQVYLREAGRGHEQSVVLVHGVGDLIRDLAGFAISQVQRFPVDPEIALGSAVTRKRMLNADPNKIAALALMEEDFSRLLPLVSTPTWILWGVDDRITPPRTGKLLAARLPRARLKMLAGAGHSPMLDKPDAFEKALLHAIQNPPAPAGPRKRGPDRGVAVCRNERDATFSGDYERIELHNCPEARLVDVRAGKVVIVASTALMENCVIGDIGKNVGLSVRGSLVTATACTIRADVAIAADNSRLDLAGVELHATKAAVLELVPGHQTNVLFSVCLLRSPHTFGHVHGSRVVTSASPL